MDTILIVTFGQSVSGKGVMLAHFHSDDSTFNSYIALMLCLCIVFAGKSVDLLNKTIEMQYRYTFSCFCHPETECIRGRDYCETYSKVSWASAGSEWGGGTREAERGSLGAARRLKKTSARTLLRSVQ